MAAVVIRRISGRPGGAASPVTYAASPSRGRSRPEAPAEDAARKATGIGICHGKAGRGGGPAKGRPREPGTAKTRSASAVTRSITASGLATVSIARLTYGAIARSAEGLTRARTTTATKGAGAVAAAPLGGRGKVSRLTGPVATRSGTDARSIAAAAGSFLAYLVGAGFYSDSASCTGIGPRGGTASGAASVDPTPVFIVGATKTTGTLGKRIGAIAVSRAQPITRGPLTRVFSVHFRKMKGP